MQLLYYSDKQNDFKFVPSYVFVCCSCTPAPPITVHVVGPWRHMQTLYTGNFGLFLLPLLMVIFSCSMLMKPRQNFISSVIAILVKAKFWSKSCGICTDNLPYTFTGGRRGGMHSHIPNNVMRTDNRISTLDLRHLPCSSQAVCMYHQERGRISDESGFGEDPRWVYTWSIWFFLRIRKSKEVYLGIIPQSINKTLTIELSGWFYSL